MAPRHRTSDALHLCTLHPPHRYARSGTFNPDSAATVGAAFLAHTVSLPSGVQVKFEIWCAAGCYYGRGEGEEHTAGCRRHMRVRGMEQGASLQLPGVVHNAPACRPEALRRNLSCVPPALLIQGHGRAGTFRGSSSALLPVGLGGVVAASVCCMERLFGACAACLSKGATLRLGSHAVVLLLSAPALVQAAA